ncbi:MAG TPA: hypothetical protein VHI98_28185 [Vicinamibacterales bacterium]|jgi:hypothetical protein|nr:hypothetical protein [Vicinamibacterales bacterium]
MKLHADVEHQEDDADFGELLGERAVGGESRRLRADHHAREEIPHDRRQPKPLGDVAEHEGRSETAGCRQDEVCTMHSALPIQDCRLSD